MSEPLHARRPGIFRLGRWCLFLLLSVTLATEPAMAQSILRDAETESLFHDIADPLIAAGHLNPKSVQIVLIQDDSINAFVATGQTVYIHTGLIAAADNANEVQGVIAHELGHITGGHAIRIQEGAKVATGIMLLSLILGAAAMAAGSAEGGAGIMAAGQQAAMGKFLAFSRDQESSADQAGSSFLNTAGISGKGMISFFKKLQNLEYRLAIPQEDAYARTHPLSGERIQALEANLKASPAWNKPIDPRLEERFERVKAKLVGYINDPRRTFILYPETDHSLSARYARAYAWHKQAEVEKSTSELDSLLRDRPNDPFFLELKGQVLLESGRPEEALESLREAVRRAPDQPLIASLLGHALIATEQPGNYDEAKKVLKAAINRDNSNPFAWYQLGIVYDHEGDSARAALATAERYNLEGVPRLAMVNAQMALQGIPNNTPDWLRAQDIALVSKSELDKDKHHRDRD
ncbi:MAG: tetratricopeptide repeat protein [Alphaproteobacteria bacterium]|nr:tetratricopeptide repeat protein [Alphaproteobacteria bacterium]